MTEIDVESMEDQISSLSLDVARLQEKLHASERELTEIQHSNNELEQQIENLESDNEKLQTNSERWQLRYLAEKRELDAVRIEVRAFQGAIKNRDESNRELAADKAKMNSELNAAHEHIREISQELYILSQINAELEEILQSYSRDQSESEASPSTLDEEFKRSDIDENSRKHNKRRFSDPAPNNRRLSDEFVVGDQMEGESKDEDMTYENDNSSETLIGDEGILDSLDSLLKDHTDIREKLDAIRDEIGHGVDKYWSKPAEIFNNIQQWDRLLIDLGLIVEGESCTENSLGVIGSLIVIMMKQQVLMKQWANQASEGYAIGPLSNCKGIEERQNLTEELNSEAELTLEIAKSERKLVEVDKRIGSSSLSFPRKVRFAMEKIEKILYFPGWTTGPLERQYPKASIEIAYQIMLVLVCSGMIIGITMSFYVGTMQCGKPAMGEDKAMLGSLWNMSEKMPWWVNSRFPGIELLLGRLEMWAQDRARGLSIG
ncbi:uncharacterized protein V1516DRAFT_297963 [Lipomyces oligophaga]|uniref:uncharacterized protein n=1 Tax=Lipomyces oligophaga TaxID=45792 RepID=UPI0034CFA614